MMHSDRPTLFGEAIKKLIPQREPVMMVDRVFCEDDNSAETGLRVRQECIFCENDRLSEPGLIEHVAQSAAAMIGYRSYVAESESEPRLGYIGEIKGFRILRLPSVGETVDTRLKVLGEADGITLVAANVRISEEEIASGRMKLFVKDEVPAGKGGAEND